MARRSGTEVEAGREVEALQALAAEVAGVYGDRPWFVGCQAVVVEGGVPALFLSATSTRAAIAAGVPLSWGQAHVPVLIRPAVRP